MTKFSGTETDNSIANVLLWGVLGLPAIAALLVLIILPLPWKEQAIFGGVVIGIAMLVNGISRGRAVTMAMMVISVFTTSYLDPFEQSQIFLLEHYLSVPLLVVLFALLLAACLQRSTERVAARRLAVGRT